MKPKSFFYPIVDAIEVSKYLSKQYGEEINVIDVLFGEVSNDVYVDYLNEGPEEEYHNEEWEDREHWELRKKIETYLADEFPDWEYVLFKICW